MDSVFKREICQLFNWSSEEFDDVFNGPQYRGIRINTLKSDYNTVASGFDFPLKKSPFYKDSYYIPSDYSGIGNHPFHHAGAFYVQEPSASSVLSAISAKKGQKVLDLCAAPGGKSTGIAAEIGKDGFIWCNEYVRKRAAALLSNIERMGITNAVVSSLSADYLCNALTGFFDIVCVDAPCSGEGMWRHNPLVEKQWSLDYVNECASLQKEILFSAAVAVRSGGRLIYSTCTFNKKENEKNVVWFLENFPEFSLCDVDAEFGTNGLSGNAEVDKKVRRISPKEKGEGHFVAVFEKGGMEEDTYFDTVKESVTPQNKKIVEEFFKENFKNSLDGVLIEKNNLVYLVPFGTPDIKGDILRYGLLVGEIRKGRLEPAHTLFNTPHLIPIRSVELDLNDERLVKFLKGEEIAVQGEKGYTGVTVLGIPLGFGKCSGERLTNKYPKGLRLL